MGMSTKLPGDRDQLLLRRLDAGLGTRLTLITAPPGSGKTALLETWQSHADWPVAVLHFEERHHDPEEFARDLVRVARQLAPDQLANTPFDGDCETVCASIINKLALMPADLVLVIEDYDPCPACDSLLGFLLEYLPPQLHLYISATESPDIASLPRLRVRRQLNEITSRELTPVKHCSI